MDKKLEYQSPQLDIVHLSLENTLLEASVDAAGADVSFGSESTFDAIFF